MAGHSPPCELCHLWYQVSLDALDCVIIIACISAMGAWAVGTLRLFLALCVVFFHLTHPMTHTLGPFAVNFFYVISGFLITLVLNETYRFKFAPFAVNRFLRLFPAYYVCAAIALALILATAAPGQFHGSWGMQLRPGDIWGNLLIFPWSLLGDPGLPINVTGWAALDSPLHRFRLVPSTWSVGVELACYGLLWLFVARNVGLALLGAAISIAWHIPNPTQRYAPIPAALLPFVLGALAYFWRDKIRALALARMMPHFPAIWLAATIAAFLCNWLACEWIGHRDSPVYFYINIAIAFLAVLAIQAQRVPGRPGLWDRWFGDLSYPVFLAHWFCGYAAWLLLGSAYPTRSLVTFIAGAALSITMAALIVRYVDKPLAAVRDDVRSASDPRSPPGWINRALKYPARMLSL